MAPASVLPSGGATLLLEREAQVAALEALTDAARSGGGRFVVIEGSAGIGKTRLLAEARAIAGSAGMRVLAARGGGFEGAAGTRPPEGEGRDPTLVAELVAGPEAAAIRPEPLGRDSIAVLARELHGLEPDEAFCAALGPAAGGIPLFIGAVLDAVAREGTSPTAEQVPRLLEIGTQGVSRAVGLHAGR